MLRAALLSSMLYAGLAPAATIYLTPPELANVHNLQQIALAMHNYESVNGRLPGQYTLANGSPGLSWRVALLPFLGAQALYNEFDLTKAWDDPVNFALLPQMPDVFRSPVDPANATTTRYEVGHGPNTIFDGPTGIHFVDITDGTSNTVLVGEANAGVPWTKPEDILIGPSPALGPGGFSSFTPGGVPFAFADGSVRFLRYGIPSDALRNYFLRNDNSVVDVADALTWAAAPEPATAGIAGAGCALLAACALRARRRTQG